MARREIAPDAFLAGVPLFKAPDAATRRALKRGETLVRRGDPATGMYVVHGEIKPIATTPARGPRLAGIAGPGRSFGEPVMFLKRPTVVDARAASDALLLHLPKEAVFEEIEHNPTFERRMIAGAEPAHRAPGT